MGAAGLFGLGFEVERVPDAPFGEAMIEIDGRFEDEGVKPVAGPRIVVPEALVHQDREAELVGLLDREVEGEVGPGTHRDALHPVEHELAGAAGTGLFGGVNSE